MFWKQIMPWYVVVTYSYMQWANLLQIGKPWVDTQAYRGGKRDERRERKEVEELKLSIFDARIVLQT